jgi:hypothetical protein
MDHEGNKKLLNHAYDHQKELGQMAASERDLLLMNMELDELILVAIWIIWVVRIFIFI